MSNMVKNKTAMVLYQIEESLGNFVINKGDIEKFSTGTIDNIHKRESDKGKNFDRNSIKNIVEATYLNELFSLAIDLVKDSSLEDSIDYLYLLFHNLDIYEVRNSISHPNKPFWDCYWYRIATIASDPVNEILGFEEVKKALVSAENGLLTDPPEEWLNQIIWQIPNNLPSSFDHSLTGLLGREKELKELNRYIESQRINTIAIVAPGGFGKTALVLDFLNNIISQPKYNRYVNAVLYTTMKTEKLTLKGVKNLDAVETIEELKTSIINSINSIYDENYTNFEKITEDYSNKKIILCIDNLETLLRDNIDNFEEFNMTLPHNWKVIVTSRVVISNATIISLEGLKEKSSIHLARSYFSKRGGKLENNKMYEEVSKKCFFNPLAIRLTIDLIITGSAVPNSINIANKEIAEFSYNNLISTLSITAIKILETIFVENLSTRMSLCELLGLTLDEISSTIGELSNTSLISRKSTEQDEIYSLSDSVKDLLIISPRNIEIRNSVQDSINKRRTLSQEIDIKQDKQDLPEWHLNYIPKETTENLKIIISEVNKDIKKAEKNSNIAIKLYKKMKETHHFYKNDVIFNRTYGRVLEELKDYRQAENYYKKAIEICPTEIIARFLLAQLNHKIKNYQEASKIYSELINQGWTKEDSSNLAFGKSIFNGYFLALLYTGNYETVLEKTTKWKDSKHYRGVLGTYRASAWKRKTEKIVDTDPKTVVESLINAKRILNDVFKNNGYFKTANKQALKIMKEIEYCFSRKEYLENFPIEGEELFKFIADNINQVNGQNENITKELITKLSVIELKENPFKKEQWHVIINENDFSDEPDNNRYTRVIITHRLKDTATFIFAKDNKGESYFLHYENFEKRNWKEWCNLSLGTMLDIKPEKNKKEAGKSKNASEIYIIE